MPFSPVSLANPPLSELCPASRPSLRGRAPPSAADSSRDMTTPFAAAAAAAPQPGQAQDYNKLFKAERDNLEFSEGLHSWIANDVDARILRKYGRLPAEAK